MNEKVCGASTKTDFRAYNKPKCVVLVEAVEELLTYWSYRIEIVVPRVFWGVDSEFNIILIMRFTVVEIITISGCKIAVSRQR